MHARLLKYVPLFLVSALMVTACGDDRAASPTAPSSFGSAALVTAEPDPVAPEFFRGGSCQPLPFRTRFGVVLRPTRDITVGSLRFIFIDRFGERTAPTVTLLQSTATGLPETFFDSPVTVPTSPTVPMPGSSTIPIPGHLGFDPLLLLSGSSRTLPVLLQFACGVPASGTIVVEVDSTDRRGRMETSQARVRVQG